MISETPFLYPVGIHFPLVASRKAYSLGDSCEDYILIVHIAKAESIPLYVQEASTAKLFITPLHGSPNVLTDTPMLQLFDPTQACKSSD
jgi:hypothetical protein